VLLVVGFRRKSVATDAEIEAAVKAMRAIRTRGGRVHDDVLRAYARAALDASFLVQIGEYRRRAELVAEAAKEAAPYKDSDPPARMG
jgi:hypothetical protein